MKPALSQKDIDNCLTKLDTKVQDLLKSDDFTATCKTAFTDADTNKNGALDGEELAQAVRVSVPEQFTQALKLNGENIKRLILSFDANKNGKIELDEFSR